MGAMLRRFSVLIAVIAALIGVTVLLFIDNIGAGYTVSENYLTDMPQAMLSEKKLKAEMPVVCLVLTDSSQDNYAEYTEHIRDVLSIMRVGYDEVDLAVSPMPELSAYRTMIAAFQNLDSLNASVTDLLEWVRGGGRYMQFSAPIGAPTFFFLSTYMGVADGGTNYATFSGITLRDGFMIGGDDFNFHWDDPMTTAISCRLGENARVYAETDDDAATPLIWSADCGKGRFVIFNVGFCEKATRGLTAAAYSLLEDTAVYPVINASAFFLDDFPSPVPMGDGTYIRRDYNRDISSFYSNQWWPDMLALGDKYGIKYTGLLIDDYTEEVDGSFPQQKDTERFTHFGSLLLDNGGEIGLHGYNHLPLCFTGFDFKGKVDYKPWTNEENALRAIDQALALGSSLFPDNTMSVYVPPSNILSEEGRRFLHEKVPAIKVIASLYLEGEIEYSQEFEVAEDGMIEFPRVISGAILDQYMRWDALNTLNLYYVNSHFMHPDDVLDVDRGAELGWAALLGNLDDYCSWLYSSAPSIRNLTGSDAGRAAARNDTLSIERTDGENEVALRLGGFYDEAYLMVRHAGGEPTEVIGGSAEHISGDFYLVRATQENVTLRFGTEGEN